MKNKFLLVVLVIVLLIILGGGFFLLSRNGQISKKTLEISPEPPTKNLKIAKRALECLNQMRDEQGIYVLGKRCSSDGSCKAAASDHRVGLNVLWGRTKYVEKTNDQAEMAILRKDINLYLDDKKVKVIQADFWSKKLLYEIWQSTFFSPKEKEKILKLAEKATNQELQGEVLTRKRLAQEGYQTPGLDKLISGEIKGGEPKKEYWFNILAAFADDYLSWSVWQNDPSSLRLAKELFYQTAEAYFSSPDLPRGSKILFGLIATDFYLATKENGYLALARQAEEKSDVKNACWWNNSCPTGLFAPIMAVMFYDNLYKITDNNEYLLVKEKIMDLLTTANLGKGFSKDNAPDDGCFFEANITNRTRSTKENGLLIGVFSQ